MDCGASGYCPDCEGEDEWVEGCPYCGGSGECPTCLGSGECPLCGGSGVDPDGQERA